MEQSQTEWDIYTGNIKAYVEQSLINRFGSTDFCRQLPICSSVNILKKLVNQKASVYKNPPTRDFIEVTDEQKDKLKSIYDDARLDFQMLQSNRLYELQKEQTHLIIEPKNGKITIKPVKAHNLNVIPNYIDPELGDFYLFSAFDKSDSDAKVQDSDYNNSPIADEDDYKAATKRFVWWSKDYHFVTDGYGKIITDKEDITTADIANPIGTLPIVEIASTKDFTYWRELSNDVAQFTVDMNVDITMLNHIVELQGFSQAFLKGPEDMMPETIDIGVTKVLKLITDPNSENGDVEFGYATPSSDIGSSIDFYLKKLALFLSSQGVDSDAVSGEAESKTYSSGLERIVAEIQKFEASRSTISLFKDAEDEIFKIVAAWYNLATKSKDVLNKKYLSGSLSEKAEVEVSYKEPTAILSELDRMELAERKQALGIYSDAEIYSTAEGVAIEVAEELFKGMTDGDSGKENDRTREDRTED